MTKTLISLELPGPKKLIQLGGINVVIGKNGSGKSSLLKAIDGFTANLLSQSGRNTILRYVTPERGGVLEYSPDVERNITANADWLKEVRRRNQYAQFKQQSMLLYRQLELIVLREIERNRSTTNDFDFVISQINRLLDNVEIVRQRSDFVVVSKNGKREIRASDISSGESEIIGLAIECITFAWECKAEQVGWLLLDEPDVHLHPDLQCRFAALLVELSKDNPMRIILATHSTALLAALSKSEDSRVCFMTNSTNEFVFRSISESLQTILPIFGAHPLSSVFNNERLLILEGEDDVRIWQRARRNSGSRINVYPVETGGNAALNAAEISASEILQSVYDQARAYSIRDRDDNFSGDMSDLGPVKRFRLRCRTAENLLLADETLAYVRTDWNELKSKIEDWLVKNPLHVHFAEMDGFRADGFDRMNHPIKSIRNDLLGMIGTNKSWEDAVGYAIGAVIITQGMAPPNSLQSFLGDNLCSEILGSTRPPNC